MYRSRDPRIVRDNGSLFVSKEWREVIRHFEIEEIPIRVRHPESNGRIERYHRSVREEVIKLVTQEKLSRTEAARMLSIPSSTLGNWVKAYKNGELGDIGKTYWPLTDIEMELARGKKENATLKM